MGSKGRGKSKNKSKNNSKGKVKNNRKVGGQECPPHTGKSKNKSNRKDRATDGIRKTGTGRAGVGDGDWAAISATKIF